MLSQGQEENKVLNWSVQSRVKTWKYLEISMGASERKLTQKGLENSDKVGGNFTTAIFSYGEEQPFHFF